MDLVRNASLILLSLIVVSGIGCSDNTQGNESETQSWGRLWAGSDDVLRVLSPNNGVEEARFDVRATRINASAYGRFGWLSQPDDLRMALINGGQWVEDHGDHIHKRKRAPKMQPPNLPVAGNVFTYSGQNWISSQEEILWVQEKDLLLPELPYRTLPVPETPVFVGYLAEKAAAVLRSGQVMIFDTEGTLSTELTECTKAQAAAMLNAESMLILCENGTWWVSSHDGIKIERSSEDAWGPAVLRAHPEAGYVIGLVGGSVVRWDTDRSYRPLFAANSALCDVVMEPLKGAQWLALDDSGGLYVFEANSTSGIYTRISSNARCGNTLVTTTEYAYVLADDGAVIHKIAFKSASIVGSWPQNPVASYLGVTGLAKPSVLSTDVGAEH